MMSKSHEEKVRINIQTSYSSSMAVKKGDCGYEQSRCCGIRSSISIYRARALLSLAYRLRHREMLHGGLICDKKMNVIYMVFASLDASLAPAPKKELRIKSCMRKRCVQSDRTQN